jgi:hypothetical protein
MKSIDPYSENPFYSIEVSHERVQKYVFVHIQYMKAANNPLLAAIIAATEDRWQELFGSLQTYDADLNLQRGLTKDVNITVSQFSYKALKLEPHIESIFDKGTDKYLEFFPHGREEIHDLTLANSLLVMNRIVTSCGKYSADIGPTWETELKDIRDNFQTLFASQQEKKGDVHGATSAYKEITNRLYIQLFRNLGTLMAGYAETPDKVATFYDQSIVTYVSHTKSVLIQKASREAFEINWKADNNIYINNLSNGPIKSFFALTADAETGTPVQTIAAKTKVKITGVAGGAPDTKFLILINETDADAKIEYRIEK